MAKRSWFLRADLPSLFLRPEFTKESRAGGVFFVIAQEMPNGREGEVGQGVQEALVRPSGDAASRRSQGGAASSPSVLPHSEVKGAARKSREALGLSGVRGRLGGGQESDLARAA